MARRYGMLAAAMLCAAMSGSAISPGDTAQAQSGCNRCNIVDEGLWNNNLVGQTVYLYSRSSGRFSPVVITAVFWEGPYKVVGWRSTRTSDSGKDLAENYYSYRSMNQIAGGSTPPAWTTDERNERAALLSVCAVAKSKDADFMSRALAYNSCCNSSAARKYGTPAGVC